MTHTRYNPLYRAPKASRAMLSTRLGMPPRIPPSFRPHPIAPTPAIPPNAALAILSEVARLVRPSPSALMPAHASAAPLQHPAHPASPAPSPWPHSASRRTHRCRPTQPQSTTQAQAARSAPRPRQPQQGQHRRHDAGSRGYDRCPDPNTRRHRQSDRAPSPAPARSRQRAAPRRARCVSWPSGSALPDASQTQCRSRRSRCRCHPSHTTSPSRAPTTLCAASLSSSSGAASRVARASMICSS